MNASLKVLTAGLFLAGGALLGANSVAAATLSYSKPSANFIPYRWFVAMGAS
jgi:hypothetical protein